MVVGVSLTKNPCNLIFNIDKKQGLWCGYV